MTDDKITRIDSIEIEKFRAFESKIALDMSADVVLVSGSNGVGKTSLSDALNIALNGSPYDPRVFPAEPKMRSLQTGSVITLDGRVVSVEAQKKGLKTKPSVAQFSSIFYQEDPGFDLSDFAERARLEAPVWVEGVKATLGMLKDELKARVEQERPIDCPTLEEAQKKTDTARQLVHSTLAEIAPDSAVSKLFDGVLLKNGNLSATGRKALARNTEISVELGWSDVLEHTGSRIREIAAVGATQDRAERENGQSSSIVQWPVGLQDHETIEFVFGDQEPSDRMWLLPTYHQPHPHVVPIRNPEVETQVEALIESLEASASEAEKRGAAFTPTAHALRPNQSSDRVEELVGKLHKLFPSWLEALAFAKIELPPMFQRVGATFEGIREEDLTEEIKALNSSIAHAIDLERSALRAGFADSYRARFLRLGLELGAYISKNSEWLDRIESSPNVSSFSALKQLLDNKASVLASIESSAQKSASERALDVANAVHKWAVAEREEEKALIQRESAKTFSAAQRAFLSMNEAIDSVIAPKKSATGLLDAEALSSQDLKQLTAMANHLVSLSNAFGSWSLALDLSKDRTKISDIKVKSGVGTNSSRLSLNDMSTGQKTMGSLALALALNLLASDHIGHKVIVLDDFGTALDQAQLPALALIIRALAYSPEEAFKRQFVLSSHHGDMTDRLIDLLTPPPALYEASPYKLLVHDFESITPHVGPKVVTYDYVAHVDDSVLSDEAMSRSVFQQLIKQGVEWIEQRY